MKKEFYLQKSSHFIKIKDISRAPFKYAKMNKKIFIHLLLVLALFHQVLCVDINTTIRDYVPRNGDIDCSGTPKNILVGSYIGGRSHIRPMLDITAILTERGYNVSTIIIIVIVIMIYFLKSSC